MVPISFLILHSIDLNLLMLVLTRRSRSIIQDFPQLCRMNLWDNPVDADEVKQLQDIGILINYNPNYVEPETES